MGETPNRDLPFPEPGDAPDGPAQIEALALALDNDVPLRVGPFVDRGDTADHPRSLYQATDGAYNGRLWYSTGGGWLEIVMRPVKSADLGDGIVTESKLGDGAVTPAKHGVAPSARVTGAVAVTPAENVPTVVEWSTLAHEDDAGMWNAADPERLTVTVAGVYAASSRITWISGGGTASGRVMELVHWDASATAEVVVDRFMEVPPASGDDLMQGVGVLAVRADVGDYFFVRVEHGDGIAPLPSLSAGDTYDHFAIARVGA